MSDRYEVFKLYKGYFKYGTTIVIDVESYHQFKRGERETIVHKLNEIKWVAEKPPIPSIDIITEKFLGYSHGMSTENFEKYCRK